MSKNNIEAVVEQLEAPVPTQLDVQVGRTWTQEDWRAQVEGMVAENLVSWDEIAATVLGALNPPQVGTSLASNANIKAQFPRRKAWQAVKGWFYDQAKPGEIGCRQCRTLLHLEAEHIQPKAELGAAADRLDNLQLLCKRCNAKKRPNFRNAGATHLTTEAGLMWILLTFRPTTYKEFERLCRAYGMTMASIRFQEAWAMAEWLAQDGRYTITDPEIGKSA